MKIFIKGSQSIRMRLRLYMEFALTSPIKPKGVKWLTSIKCARRAVAKLVGKKGCVQLCSMMCTMTISFVIAHARVKREIIT